MDQRASLLLILHHLHGQIVWTLTCVQKATTHEEQFLVDVALLLNGNFSALVPRNSVRNPMGQTDV